MACIIFERIANYALDGYTPFWMKKGVVDPWYPNGRWDTLPRSAVKDSPETEWFLGIARVVDKIEKEGRMEHFKVEGSKLNPYREKILDDVCMHAFGTTHPPKKGIPFAWHCDCKDVCKRARNAEHTSSAH